MNAAVQLMAACMVSVPVIRRRCLGAEGADHKGQN
jgi:hypothetical protein